MKIKNEFESSSPEISDNNGKNNNNTDNNISSNSFSLASRMAQNLKHHGTEIVFYYFPGVPSNCLYQPVIFDFKDTKDGYPHWGHKPDAHLNIMRWISQEPDLKDSYDPFF